MPPGAKSWTESKVDNVASLKAILGRHPSKECLCFKPNDLATHEKTVRAKNSGLSAHGIRLRERTGATIESFRFK